MPASRRAPKNAQRGAQSTLSFGSRSKVTKASLPSGHSIKEAALHQEIVKSPASTTTSEVDSQPNTVEIAIREQAKEEVKKVTRTSEEELAAKIDDAQLKRYWKEREAERKAPRVHQEDLSMDEKILRHFDLSSQYGPCIGIARMKRWNRANKLNLRPPLEVLAVLLKEEGKGNVKSERAYVDELLSSRFVVE